MKNKIIEIFYAVLLKYVPSPAKAKELSETAATRIMEQLGECYVECDASEATGVFHSVCISSLADDRTPLKKLPSHPKEEPKDSAEERYLKAVKYLTGSWKWKVSDMRHAPSTKEALKIAAGLPPTVETKKD